VCGAFYTTSHVEAWAGSNRASRYVEPIATKPFFVAVLQGELVGVPNLDLQQTGGAEVYPRPRLIGLGCSAQAVTRVSGAPFPQNRAI